jgi:hypothetical protein
MPHADCTHFSQVSPRAHSTVLGLFEGRKENAPVTTKLPRPVGKYFAATNAHDVAAMGAAFAQNAIVRDEGREHQGSSAIRAWMKKTIEKYDYQVEPLESSRMAKRTSVLVSIRGTFPGSPITLNYEFTLEKQRIARLEIE